MDDNNRMLGPARFAMDMVRSKEKGEVKERYPGEVTFMREIAAKAVFLWLLDVTWEQYWKASEARHLERAKEAAEKNKSKHEVYWEDHGTKL